MQALIVDDELWKLIGPLQPTPKLRRTKSPGRLPVPNRAALNDACLCSRPAPSANATQLGFGSGAMSFIKC